MLTTVTALKRFTLYGESLQHGSPLGDLWTKCTKRQRQYLERGRYITHTPVATPDMAPRGLTTPRNAGGAPVQRRGRPRKES